MTMYFDWLIPCRVIHSHVTGIFNPIRLNRYFGDLFTYLNEGMNSQYLLVNTSNITMRRKELDLHSCLQPPMDCVLKKLDSVYVIDNRTVLPWLPFVSSFFYTESIAIKRVKTVYEAVEQLKQLDDSLSWDIARFV